MATGGASQTPLTHALAINEGEQHMKHHPGGPKTRHRAAFILVAVALLSGAPREALAQLKGHYIPGFAGLQSGSQAPPSISVILPVYFYTTDDTSRTTKATRSHNPASTCRSSGPVSPG
jgi:hypothetical protein